MGQRAGDIEGIGGKMNYVQTRSGLLVPEYIANKPDHLTAFDFFCGCGGFSLGLLQAGNIEIVGANEWDAAATLTYLLNLGHYPCQIHYIDGEKDKERLNKAVMKQWGLKGNGEIKPDQIPADLSENCAGSGWIKTAREIGKDVMGVKNFWFGDVRKLKGADILNTLGMEPGDIDIVTGGPPCQGYSTAGKQDINDPRNKLVYEYARLIVELKPKTFIMEEVPAIINFYDSDGVPVLDKFCLMLEEGGYGLWDKIKKSLLMQAGAAGVIRGKPREKKLAPKMKRKVNKKTIKKEPVQVQQELF
jgi:DNA (cytosine-5)-methyltransferase 1